MENSIKTDEDFRERSYSMGCKLQQVSWIYGYDN